MADKAHRETDKQIASMERKLSAIYGHTDGKIKRLMLKYAKLIDQKAKPLYEAIANATSEEEKQKAKADYVKFYKAQTKTEEFQKLSRDVANELYLTNEQATNYINDKMGDVYALNYNQVNKNLKRDLKEFNSQEISGKDVIGLQKQTVNKKKDNKWNESNIKKAVITGAILALSTDGIMKRSGKNVTRKNRNFANMHTSGMFTYAENEGRMDGMYRANDLGYDIRKRWIATLDNKTRDTHAMVDGEERRLDEKFSNGLMYPRDPSGDPAEICNCRCDVEYVVKNGGIPTESRTARHGEVTGSYREQKSFRGTQTIEVKNMNYRQWKRWHSGI